MLTHTQIPDALFDTYIQPVSEGVQLTAEEKLELLEKTQLFELALDARRYDAIEAFITDDFVYNHALTKRTGKKAHTEFWQTNEAVLLKGIRHQPVNVIVYPEKDGTATSVGYLNVVKFADTPDLPASDKPVLMAHGIQVMNFRKENGVWKLARLTIDQMAVSQAFPIDDATRRYFATPAEERDQLRQPLF
jgi:hypothetical protein